jgi:antitoxin component of RelBE/YafQ-DinJ toxin-antitoxin module
VSFTVNHVCATIGFPVHEYSKGAKGVVMTTSIVNAKVDSYLKRRVDEVLKRERRTASEVIKATWEEIARTGDLPQNMREKEEVRQQELMQKKLESYHAAIGRSSLPSEYVNRDYREILADVMMERQHG